MCLIHRPFTFHASQKSRIIIIHDKMLHNIYEVLVMVVCLLDVKYKLCITYYVFQKCFLLFSECNGFMSC